MKLPLATNLSKLLKWRYSQYVIIFSAGAGLELFMNFFHVGEISIYRSIKRSLSDSRAEEQFLREKSLFETIENGRVEV